MKRSRSASTTRCSSSRSGIQSADATIAIVATDAGTGAEASAATVAAAAASGGGDVLAGRGASTLLRSGTPTESFCMSGLHDADGVNGDSGVDGEGGVAERDSGTASIVAGRISNARVGTLATNR